MNRLKLIPEGIKTDEQVLLLSDIFPLGTLQLTSQMCSKGMMSQYLEHVLLDIFQL
jgi:hypothetical protein